MSKTTKEDAEHIRSIAEEAIGDLVPVPPPGEGFTPEQLDQINVVAEILMGLPKRALAGGLAGSLVGSYGKGAPLVARRMVETMR